MTLNGVRLGDMLVELAAPGITESRRTEIVRHLNELGDRENVYSSWLRRGDADPHFQTLHSRFGIFDQIPLAAAFYKRGVTQSIPNNTVTPLSIDTYNEDASWFTLDQTDPTKIRLNASAQNRRLGIVGAANFASNGTGRRAVHIEAYDSSDAQIYGLTLTSLLPTGLNTDVFPFANVLAHSQTLISTAYVKLTVFQDSGGALNIIYAAFELFLME